MSKTIIIDPVTRISGFLEIRAEADEQNTIVKADSSGLLFRGFEKMLLGRVPFDSTYFCERICGICSTAHSLSATLALEDALELNVSQNDKYIRDVAHGFEIIQNQIRHFYLLTIPDYARIKSLKLIDGQKYSDFRLPDQENEIIEKHYLESIHMSRLAHEGLSVLGGKAPHTHGIFVGGVTTEIDPYKLEKVKSIISEIISFVSSAMKEDFNILSKFYQDYYEKGASYPNFMSYGMFDGYEEEELTYVKPGVMKDGVRYDFHPEQITEQIKYAWYKNDNTGTNVDLSKENAYSFIKAPKYDSSPMEVGSLARMMISGEYTRGNSCLDRIAARVMETEKVLDIMYRLACRTEILPNNQKTHQIPTSAMGVGLTDTSRGSLGHWIQIDNQVISHYNIIAPSVWNLSPKGDDGIPGVIEKSLMGTRLENVNEPVEIGRIVRSFDPCVSCATHLIGGSGGKKTIEVLV